MEIKPNLKILQKYFHLDEDLLSILSFNFHFFKTFQEQWENIELRLVEYDLTEHNEDFKFFFLYYKPIVNGWRNEREVFHNQIKHFRDELKQLEKMFSEKVKESPLEEEEESPLKKEFPSNGLYSITISTKGNKSYRFDSESMLIDLNNFLFKGYKKINRKFPNLSYKLSTYNQKTAERFYPLLQYLIGETSIKNKNAAYVFIAKFMEDLGFDFTDVATIPETYLKNIFTKLKSQS